MNDLISRGELFNTISKECSYNSEKPLESYSKLLETINNAEGMDLDDILNTTYGKEAVTKALRMAMERALTNLSGMLSSNRAQMMFWNPVKTRPMTDKEKEEYQRYMGDLADPDYAYIFNCVMPEDGQEILICSRNGYVDMDICENDGMEGIGLENNGDWDGIVAWMPMPKPYKTTDE